MHISSSLNLFRGSHSSNESEGPVEVDFPRSPDGTKWNGKDLSKLISTGNDPFRNILDIKYLIDEVENAIGSQVVDIPKVSAGAHNYGFAMKLSDGRNILVRLSKTDMNKTVRKGISMELCLKEFHFEVAIYKLLQNVTTIPTSHLLYYRHCHHRDETQYRTAKQIKGRNLVIFELTKGKNFVWDELNEAQKILLINKAAAVRAALLHWRLPSGFTKDWLVPRIFHPGLAIPEDLQSQPTPTRDFCISVLKAKVEAVFRMERKAICRMPAKKTVDPNVIAAKQSLLRFIPHMLPEGDDENLYRFVLQHDDYGIHNMSIYLDEKGGIDITSVYDWETGCIVPLILSEIDFLIFGRYLTVDEDGEPAWRLWDPEIEVEPHWPARFQEHARHYVKAIKGEAAYLENAIHVGKDARHLWLMLKRWRGHNSQKLLCDLGSWAETRMKEIGL